jgi:HSP90 family molecular chaperone
MSEVSTRETLGFQAEVKQLLHLMVHSLYSNKEIFLRELVSNASDACDKLRFEALADTTLWESDPDLKIRVSYDKTARTLSVSDNGVGMSRDEVISNIGTIAKSGTREFFQTLTGDQAKDAHLIGQFGVGFYSSFIVADKVTLATRRAGMAAEHGVRWESTGEGDYTLETVTREGRGTEVTLHLREGEDELLSGFRLRSILRKYSDQITIPILMTKEEWDKDKGEHVTKDGDEQINQASALWARPKSEITDEQYQEFYKHVGHRKGQEASENLSSWALLAAEVWETAKSVIVRVEIPGMDKEDFDISVQGSVLRIRGEKRSRGEQQGRLYFLLERAYGRFERTIALPHNVDGAQAEVTYQDGVLTVILPKTEVLPPRQLTVQ